MNGKPEAINLLNLVQNNVTRANDAKVRIVSTQIIANVGNVAAEMK